LPLPDCVWTIHRPKATDFTYFRIRQTPFFPGSAGLYLLRRSEWCIRLLFRLAGGNIVLQRFILKGYLLSSKAQIQIQDKGSASSDLYQVNRR
jgi:hypothetical protein